MTKLMFASMYFHPWCEKHLKFRRFSKPERLLLTEAREGKIRLFHDSTFCVAKFYRPKTENCAKVIAECADGKVSLNVLYNNSLFQ